MASSAAKPPRQSSLVGLFSFCVERSVVRASRGVAMVAFTDDRIIGSQAAPAKLMSASASRQRASHVVASSKLLDWTLTAWTLLRVALQIVCVGHHMWVFCKPFVVVLARHARMPWH
eukprot:3919895-Rhodomonas_salina.1